jgi:Sulfotransferase family
MLGSPRTGTTWLLNLLRAQEEIVGIDEPVIGLHLGLFLPDLFIKPAWTYSNDQKRVNEARGSSDDYFFADRYRHTWQPQLRELILSRFAAQFEELDGRGATWCFIKEPNGSQAADILMQTLPGSRLLWILRDGRDVVDSEVDAAKKGSWLTSYGGDVEWSPEQRLDFVRERAYRWAWRQEIVGAAYEAHPAELRLRISYEDLLSETEAGLREILGWLGVTPRADLADLVAKGSFDAIPEAERGPGKFVRSASPGAWRANLTPDECQALDEICGPQLRALGYS